MKRQYALILLFSSLLMVSCGNSKANKESSTSQTVGNQEWISLFNGEDFSGWEMYGEEPIMDQWRIVDGTIACNVGLGDKNAGFNRSIMTTKDYGNFELELEYKIAKGGNSGIFYHVVELEDKGHDYFTGPEFQLLDDEFSRSESDANKMLGANYAMQAPAETKKANPFMEWNKIKIVYFNGHVEHWLNGEKILEFEEESEDWLAQKAAGKWNKYELYAKSKTGRISLQNHGDEVYFKNIRIKEL
ncbi:3-keto-disaccharide hydrolase [Roseivirga echinicomitans]